MGSGRRQGAVLIALLLDTDIGSDVDDELALALLWGSPEVAVEGVCTTYGDVALRTGIVEAMAGMRGREVRVAPGEPVPRSGREVWWAGHEGHAYARWFAERRQDEGAGPDRGTGEGRRSAGVRLLVEHAPERELLAIGPLTSVAAALDAGAAPDRLTVMGGDWRDAAVGEHNLASDWVAARRVLTAGLPTTVVGLDVTRRVRFGGAEVDRFAACGRLGGILAAEMRAWMARWDEAFEVPHDPLTALAIVEPGLFRFAEPCAVAVSDGSDGPEGAVRRLDEPGTVRVAIDVDVEAARRSMADRIARGLGEGAS